MSSPGVNPAPLKPRILIVEDEGLIALDIENRVRKAGFDVSGIVDSGEGAIEKVEEARPDLILMDIRLNGSLDGIETARRVQHRHDIPVIYLTAHTDSETVKRAKITGPFGYLAKPISQSALSLSLEMALYKHKVESELRQQRAWMRTSLNAMSDAVIITDQLGCVRYVNPAAEQLTGWSASESLGQALSHILKLVPVDGPGFAGAAEFLAPSGGPRIFPPGLKMVTRGGRQIAVEGEITPSSEDGIQLGEVVVLRDITRRESQEQERRHQLKMEAVGRLAAGVAHDFNNLLTVILGQVHLVLKSKAALDDHTRDAVAQIGEAGNSVAAITRQLLTFSRYQVTKPYPVSLRAVIRDNESACRMLLRPGIEWRTSLHPALETVVADPAQLAQVLINLVTNAVDAMPGGGTLTVATGRAGTARIAGINRDLDGYVFLSVSDTGVGIDPSVAEHVFEPFFSTKPVGKGPGLGLSIVYNVVNQLGGVASIDSQPGSGTTVRVFLPVSDNQLGTRAPATSFENPTGDRAMTVLVVDDNEGVRNVMNSYLEACGYSVLAAADGPRALALAGEFGAPIDVLVTDVVMPKMNGLQLAEKLTQLRPGLKTIFVSGYPGDVLSDRGPQLESARFLQKPFLHSDLAREIEQLFGTATAGASGCSVTQS
jgi:two-component system cell cycle sensor histidine kinase/response regulator CckA